MTHRVLIIGVGSIGERHLRCFGKTGRAKLTFCETNPALRQAVQERYGIEHAYESLDQALDAGACDAAVICTPAPLHVSMAIQLARQGIHLMIEKPLSTSLGDVDRLQQVIDDNDLAVTVGYTHRANPVLQAMRREIQHGRIGSPKEILVRSGQHFPTFRPAYRDIYYTRRETGGGAIQDALTHLLNAGEWLVGSITRLACDAAHQVLEGVEVEDTVHVITRHDGVMGSFSLNQFQRPNESIMTIHGDQGTIQLMMPPNQLRWMTEINGHWHEQRPFQMERDTLYIRQAEAFLDLLEGKAEPLCSLAEGVQTLKVNLAALKAADEGVWVAVE